VSPSRGALLDDLVHPLGDRVGRGDHGSVTVTRMSSTCPVGSRHSSLTLTESSSRSSRFTVHGTVATLGMPIRS
jgi:hypothetical protein